MSKAAPTVAPVASRVIGVYYSEEKLSDGTIVRRPLREIVPGADVTAPEAAALFEKDARSIQRYCEQGVFLTARKSGPKPQSRWIIARAEVLEKKANGF
jgi:hypothetical protein